MPIQVHQPPEKWHDHGGWNFAFPPALTTRAHPAIWRACHAPSVIIFQGNAGNFQPVSIWSMLRNYELLQDKTTIEGRHLVLGEGKRRHRLLLTPLCSLACGYSVPQDRYVRTRLSAIEGFDPSCRSFGPGKSRDVLFPSAYQKHRLILLLRILDAIDCADHGLATIRDIAQQVVYRHADFGRTIEWKSSSHRRQTQRLLSEARHLVKDGYRCLLSGSIR